MFIKILKFFGHHLPTQTNRRENFTCCSIRYEQKSKWIVIKLCFCCFVTCEVNDRHITMHHKRMYTYKKKKCLIQSTLHNNWELTCVQANKFCLCFNYRANRHFLFLRYAWCKHFISCRLQKCSTPEESKQIVIDH